MSETVTRVQVPAVPEPEASGSHDAQGGPDLSPTSLFGSLPLLRVHCRIHIHGRETLPPYLGSAWRGLLARCLKRACCPVDRGTECGDCASREICPYFILFEMKTSLPGLAESPRGYIFFPHEDDQRGEHLLQIVLFGRCCEYLPLLEDAVWQGRGVGLGANRVRYDVLGSHPDDPVGGEAPAEPISAGPAGRRNGFPLSQWISGCPSEGLITRIRLSTPLRLRRRGSYMVQMDWPFFFSCLARRLEALTRLWSGGSPVGREGWLELMDRFSHPPAVDGKTRWHEYSRYSSRQDRTVPMGGLVGDVEMQTDDSWWRSWWQAASLIHVGKGAGMGLGKIDIL